MEQEVKDEEKKYNTIVLETYPNYKIN